MIDPDVRAQMSVATNTATPGSVVARAFITAARGLALDEFFDQPTPSEPVLREPEWG